MAEEKRIYGKGNVELKRKVKVAAAISNLNVEDWVTDAIKEKLEKEGIISLKDIFKKGNSHDTEASK